MKLNVQKLEENVLILEERLKKINHRLYIETDDVVFRTIDGFHRWFSVGEIYSKSPYIQDREPVPMKEWESIPHELVLKTVKEWQEEFGTIEESSSYEMNIEESSDVDVKTIPDLKIKQLRLNIHGELCLLIKFNDNDDIAAWNFDKEKFEIVAGCVCSEEHGADDDWKKRLPKVVIDGDGVDDLANLIKRLVK